MCGRQVHALSTWHHLLPNLVHQLLQARSRRKHLLPWPSWDAQAQAADPRAGLCRGCAGSRQGRLWDVQGLCRLTAGQAVGCAGAVQAHGRAGCGCSTRAAAPLGAVCRPVTIHQASSGSLVKHRVHAARVAGRRQLTAASCCLSRHSDSHGVRRRPPAGCRARGPPLPAHWPGAPLPAAAPGTAGGQPGTARQAGSVSGRLAGAAAGPRGPAGQSQQASAWRLQRVSTQFCRCSALCVLQHQQAFGYLEVDSSVPQCVWQVRSISRQHSCSSGMLGACRTLPGWVRWTVAQHVRAMRSCTTLSASTADQQSSGCLQGTASTSQLDVGAQQCTGASLNESVTQGNRRTSRACRMCWQASV